MPAGTDPFGGGGDEVADDDTAFDLKSLDDALQRICLMELDIGVGVTVLDSDDKAADSRHTRKVPFGLLVGVLRILLVAGRRAGRWYLIVDLVESRKTTLFCSDFWIRAYFEHYYGETLFLLAFLHNIIRIMLLQLDSSRIPYEICSS